MTQYLVTIHHPDDNDPSLEEEAMERDTSREGSILPGLDIRPWRRFEVVTPIPEGYRSVTPYLIFEDANAAIGFYERAFGAQELLRMPMGNRLVHAEIQIGNSRIMLADEAPQMDAYGPKHHNGSPVSLMLYVEDVDTFTGQAIAAGVQVLRPVQNQFYGDRSGTFLDPFGYKWTIGTHVEDISPEEMETRMAGVTKA